MDRDKGLETIFLNPLFVWLAVSNSEVESSRFPLKVKQEQCQPLNLEVVSPPVVIPCVF